MFFLMNIFTERIIFQERVSCIIIEILYFVYT